jgi:hypothetical protein
VIRTLHFFWDGPSMPDPLRENLIAWYDLHPQWEFVVWDSASTRWLTHRDLYERAAELTPPDAIWQFRSDLARYEILLRHGGFYADVDTRPLQPIDPFIGGHDAFAAAEDRDWVGNTYLYCEPGNPVMRAIVEGLRANVEARTRLGPRRPNRLSGPRYITPIWRAAGAYVAPSRSWFPYSYNDVKRRSVPDIFGDHVIAVHQWNHHRELLGVGYL